MLLEEIRERIQTLAEEVAADVGLEVDDVAIARSRAGWQVRVVLDRVGGFVDVAACGAVNERLRARLELEKVMEGDFALEVSSPGLDRPLRSPADYERFRGFLARFKVRGGAGQGGCLLEGRIVGVGPDSLEVDAEDGRHDIPFDLIADARLEPELPGFTRDKISKGKKSTARRSRGRR